jgi:glycosyltransferase involved in cell wall biosynthesis
MTFGNDSPGSTPEFSVLISTHNRAHLLNETLNHLRNQAPGVSSWELIVVNNGSFDETSSVLDRAKVGLPLIVVDEPQLGKSRALNKALKIARGDLLIFTDDDIEPAPGWLNQLISAAQRWPDHNIFGGAVIAKFPAGTPVWLREHPYSAIYFANLAPEIPEGPVEGWPVGPNYAIRARTMEGLSFNTKLGPQGKINLMGDETELFRKLLARGERTIYVPSAIIRHIVRERQIKPRWLRKRAFYFGRSEARIECDNSSNRLFGAPQDVWKRFGVVCKTYLLSGRRSNSERFEIKTQFYFICGKIYEYYRMANELKNSK